MPRRLTAADHEAWAAYARLVRPRSPCPAPVEPPAPAPAPATAPVPAPVSAPPRLHGRPAVLPGGVSGHLAVNAHPTGIDTGTWTRFRTGRLPTLRTLDLHGRTAQAAYAALHVFLRGAHAEGLRCVEIITGRGQGEGGVIRRELPHWLNNPDLRPLVLAAAHPHAANPGSVRVLLRRVR